MEAENTVFAAKALTGRPFILRGGLRWVLAYAPFNCDVAAHFLLVDKREGAPPGARRLEAALEAADRAQLKISLA